MIMDDFRDELQRQIVGNIIKDRCSEAALDLKWLDYQDAYCSGYSVVRFGTDALDRLSAEQGLLRANRGTGHAIMYAIDNAPEGLSATLAVNEKLLGAEKTAQMEQRLNRGLLQPIAGAQRGNAEYRWVLLGDEHGEMAQLKVEKAVDHFIYEVVPDFESEFACNYQREEAEEELREGANASVVLDRYERNPEARARCLEVHGCRCAICGFDFGEFYGDACKGMIEVHHIEPLSSIREEHVVDPVEDLIPVCPNCHWVLHADPRRVRSPEEVRKMLKRVSG